MIAIILKIIIVVLAAFLIVIVTVSFFMLAYVYLGVVISDYKRRKQLKQLIKEVYDKKII